MLVSIVLYVNVVMQQVASRCRHISLLTHPTAIPISWSPATTKEQGTAFYAGELN